MARNRVIYQSEALYVSKNVNSTETGEHRQLTRVQSANYNFSIDRKDVNQYGELARIDALVLKSPTVALDFSYYPTDGFNERALGFYVQRQVPVFTGDDGLLSTEDNGGGFSGYSTLGEGNFSSGQMGSSSGQHFYILTTSEGSDLNNENTLSGKSVIGIGNGFLTNYSVDASVGNLATVKVTIEGLNMNSSTYQDQLTGFGSGVYRSGATYFTGRNPNPTLPNAGYTFQNNIYATSDYQLGLLSPQVDPTAGSATTGANGKPLAVKLPNPSHGTGSNTPSALRPGDIVLSFGDYGAATEGFATPIANMSGTAAGIGSDGLHLQSASLALPLSRTPIERLGSRFAFARVVDFPIVSTLNVSAILNETQSRNLASMLDDNTERDVTIKIKSSKDTSKDALIYMLKGSRLKSESFSSSIGSNKTVDLVFETQIGGPNDSKHGLFLSGIGTGDYKVSAWAY
jgi:hypothetical protein